LFCPAQQSKLLVSPPTPLTVKRGGTAVANLRVEVLSGFHVNSDKPKDEYLIPLKLTWLAGPLEATSLAYPKPEEAKVGADLLNVFTGTFTIQTDFRTPATAKTGSTIMTGKLRYQACNNQMCFRPATIDVKLPVMIE
jgi:DsbC/DsbD-like thiol-disulfide interchange protein